MCAPRPETTTVCSRSLTGSHTHTRTYFSGCFEAVLRVCPALELLRHLAWAGAQHSGPRLLLTTSPSSRRRNGKVQHCRIHSRQDAGAPKFFLTDNLVFDSLYDLITHYQQVPLRCNEFEMRLSEPVPQTNAHESKE